MHAPTRVWRIQIESNVRLAVFEGKADRLIQLAVGQQRQARARTLEVILGLVAAREVSSSGMRYASTLISA